MADSDVTPLTDLLRDPQTWDDLDGYSYGPDDLNGLDVLEVPIPLEGNISYVGEPPSLSYGRQLRPTTDAAALVFVGQAIDRLVAVYHNWQAHHDSERRRQP